MREPQVHSHITDCLPDEHPFARKYVFCDHPGCNAQLHAGNNECMETWIETGIGNFCLEHSPLVDCLNDSPVALPSQYDAAWEAEREQRRRAKSIAYFGSEEQENY